MSIFHICSGSIDILVIIVYKDCTQPSWHWVSVSVWTVQWCQYVVWVTIAQL